MQTANLMITYGIAVKDDAMKFATYNVNGINGRLPVLLRWLEQSEPDIVCLQELKTSD
jgi:exodeoxyribonuclease-3